MASGGKGKGKVPIHRPHGQRPRRIADDASIYCPMPTTNTDVHSTYEHGGSSTVPTASHHTGDDVNPTNSSSSSSPNDDDDQQDTHGSNLHSGVDDGVLYTPDNRVIIRPAGSAFLPSKPSSTAITKVIKEKCHHPWTSWGQIVDKEKDADMMFGHFQTKCAWEPQYTEKIKENFHHRASRRYSDMLRAVRKKGKKPKWMGRNVFKALEAYWSSDEYKKIQERNKINRASEKGGSLYTGGSINTAEWRERMVAELGRPVGVHELHRRVHTRKADGEFVEERARKVQEDFAAAMDQYQGNVDSGTPTNPDDVSRYQLQKWVEVTGGKKKGRLYGAGVLSSCYKKGVSYLNINAADSSSSSSFASTGRSRRDDPYVRDLEQRLDATQRTATEAVQQNKTLFEKFEEMQQQQRQLIALLSQQGRPSPSPPPPTGQQQYSHPHAHLYNSWQPPQPQPYEQPRSQTAPSTTYIPQPPHQQPNFDFQVPLTQPLPNFNMDEFISTFLSQSNNEPRDGGNDGGNDRGDYYDRQQDD